MKKLIPTLVIMLAGLMAEAKQRPNFIFIMVDDAGYGDFSCFGQEKFMTPNIDRMAAKGMKFTQHYAGSTVCAPTRCCLMTGQHTGHTPIRVKGNAKGEPENVFPIASMRPVAVPVRLTITPAPLATK